MRIVHVLAVGLALGVSGGMSAYAQPERGKAPPAGERPGRGEGNEGQGERGRGGRPARLTKEQSQAAWSLEAAGVAESLKLDSKQTDALARAYIDARNSHAAAIEAARENMRNNPPEEGGPQAGRQRMQDLMKSERGKFEKAIGEAGLTEAQKQQVMATLGSFNPQWDQMVTTLKGMNLDAAKMSAAQTAVREHVAATVKARESMGGPDADREAMRTAMQDARKKMMDSLKKVLSEEQMAKFEESLGGGRGRGGEGRRPGGAGGDEGRPPRPEGEGQGGQPPRRRPAP